MAKKRSSEPIPAIPDPNIPRGIEVLVKKASIDSEFRALLLEDPILAAGTIDLALEPIERSMLEVISQDRLESIIRATVVPESHRRAFLGKAAGAMLLLLGVQVAGMTGCNSGPSPTPFGGIRPDNPQQEPIRPIPAGGIRPDTP